MYFITNLCCVCCRFTDEAAEDYAATVAGVCDIFKRASDAGIICVVAAGNFGSSIRSYLPAACPTVATVTALENTRAASWSNFLPSYDSTDAEKAHVIAAPGASVLSSTSFAKEPSGYRVLSGTSMAGKLPVNAHLIVRGSLEHVACGLHTWTPSSQGAKCISAILTLLLLVLRNVVCWQCCLDKSGDSLQQMGCH
jgi:hypothetical protein